MTAIVAAKLSRGRSFPMGSHHRRGHSLNLGLNDYDKGGLDLFLKNRQILPLAPSSSEDSCDSSLCFPQSHPHFKFPVTWLKPETRASHISVTEDGLTAENEDVANSEVEGSSSVPISQHAKGVKRFVGSGDSSDAQKEVRRFADSNVVDLNGQKRFNISSENEYKLGNMAYGRTQPVNPGNLPVMFGYSPVQLPMLDKDNSWGVIPHAQQIHHAYAGRNPPAPATSSASLTSPPAISSVTSWLPRPSTRLLPHLLLAVKVDQVTISAA
ncbi:hypothetical protein FF1_005915 [Malus domestica]